MRKKQDKKNALLRKIILDPELNEILWLVRNGVPFDVAFSLSAEERFAWAVIFHRMNGANFNFRTMKFDAPE